MRDSSGRFSLWMALPIAVALTILALAGVIWLWPRYPLLFRHRPEDPGAKEWVQVVQNVSVQNISRVELYTGDRCGGAVLRPATDRADIHRLLRALQSIRVVKREVSAQHNGMLFIYPVHPIRGLGWTSMRLQADFDPAHAPIISPAMRSDDLGRIVQDIVRRKGVATQPPWQIDAQTRRAVAGLQPHQVAHVRIEAPPHFMIVRDRRPVSLLLAGLQGAMAPEDRAVTRTDKVTLVLSDGRSLGPFYFARDRAVDAFSYTFVEGLKSAGITVPKPEEPGKQKSRH